jgi:antitoxin VapB
MRQAKLFMNGKSQAVRLPKAFRFSGTSVLVKRHGSGVLLLPMDEDPWKQMEDSLAAFAPDFDIVRDQGTQQERPPFGVSTPPSHADQSPPRKQGT